MVPWKSPSPVVTFPDKRSMIQVSPNESSQGSRQETKCYQVRFLKTGKHSKFPNHQFQEGNTFFPSVVTCSWTKSRFQSLIFLVWYFMSFLRFSFTYTVELILSRTIIIQPVLHRTVEPCSLQYLWLLSSSLYRHAAVFSPPSCGRRKVLSCCPCCPLHYARLRVFY